jgi:hypothetical protein
MAVVWLWLRQVEPHDIPPRRGEVNPSFSILGHGELFSGVPPHGLRRGRWPATGGADDDSV